MTRLEYESNIDFDIGNKKYTLLFTEKNEADQPVFYLKLQDQTNNCTYTSTKINKRDYHHCLLSSMRNFSVWAKRMLVKSDAASFTEEGRNLILNVKEHDKEGFLGSINFSLTKDLIHSSNFKDEHFSESVEDIKLCNSSNIEIILKENVAKSFEYLFSQVAFIREELKKNVNSDLFSIEFQKIKEEIKSLSIKTDKHRDEQRKINTYVEELRTEASSLEMKNINMEELRTKINYVENQTNLIINTHSKFSNDLKINTENKEAELQAQMKEINETFKITEQMILKPSFALSREISLYGIETVDFVKSFILPKTSFTRLVLLFDSNVHGDSAKVFHEKCDNKGPTISFIWDDKCNIFGGFTNLSWSSSNGGKEEKNSFLFSVNKKKIINIDQNFQFAIYDYENYGPCYGWGGGNDLCIKNECTKNGGYQNLKYSYGSRDINAAEFEFTGEQNFIVKEYKVFSVSS